MITPRPYISYSQMSKFEMDPRGYVEEYIYGHKRRPSKNMLYGSAMAEGLEDEEATGDPLLDLMMSKIPKLELMDKPIYAELSDGKEMIKILAKPDSLSTICPECCYNYHWDMDMIQYDYEKQKRTLHQRPQSAHQMEDVIIQSQQRENTEKCLEERPSSNSRIQEKSHSMEQGGSGNNESMEQRQEILRGDKVKNECFENGHKIATIHNRIQRKNQQGIGQGKDKCGDKIQKHNGVSELETIGHEEGQLDLSTMQDKGWQATRRPHKAIRPLPKTSSEIKQRQSALRGVPQEYPNVSKWNKHCKTCHGEPYIRMFEYKTSVRKWTQKMVDQSGQITFYATAIWLKTHKIPEDIELIHVQTAYDNGKMTVTGEIYNYPTQRTVADAIKMCTRIRKAWVGIKALCEKELI